MTTALDDSLATCTADVSNTQDAIDYGHYYSTIVIFVMNTDAAINQQLIDMMTLFGQIVAAVNAVNIARP